MNTGTIIRTILVITTSLNTALLATDVTGFSSPTLDFIYKVASVVLNFVIVFCATYYNNDYTEEAAIGTGLTRQLKAQEQIGYEDEFIIGDPNRDGEDDDE